MQSWVSCKSFNLYDVEFDLCLSVRDVISYPLRCELTVWWSMLWFEQWFKWWRWLIPSWYVVLESAKDRILGVDTLGQHVPPCVRYGATCLLIRNTIGCVSCADEWEMAWWFTQAHMVQDGHVGETLELQAGHIGKTVAKHDTAIVDLCNDM
jgi:hypothetical protein